MKALSRPQTVRTSALIVRGAAAVAAGIVAIGISPETAKLLLGVYLAVDGLVAIAVALRLPMRVRARALFAVDGFADVLVAYVLIAWAAPVALLVLVVAIWTLATGVLELAASLLAARVPALAWAVALLGLLSCCVGLIAVDWTSLAEIAMLYVFGAYVVVVTALVLTIAVLLARSLRLRT